MGGSTFATYKDRRAVTKRVWCLADASTRYTGAVGGRVLEGDVRQGVRAPTREQIDWEHLVASRCRLTDQACADLIHHPHANDQTTLLCRSACVLRYKAVRAPITEYLLRPEFKHGAIPIVLYLQSDEWNLTENVRLSIAFGRDETRPRVFTVRLYVSGFGWIGDIPEKYDKDLAVWKTSQELAYWNDLAEKHHMWRDTTFSGEFQDRWTSPLLDIDSTANILSAFLWSAERGTLVSQNDAVRASIYAMIAQVNPGIVET
jgi:hypothetical protein